MHSGAIRRARRAYQRALSTSVLTRERTSSESHTISVMLLTRSTVVSPMRSGRSTTTNMNLVSHAMYFIHLVSKQVVSK
jgi:hypothetical protein